MDAGQHAVCVALNDNDRAWYEMLVPFILSLRQTDYRGHLVVIGFGLSQKKIEILQAQSVGVVVALEPSLAYGRYLEVARLCEMNPSLTKVALYDADIWFCSEAFDLFDQMEGDDLHVCRDSFLCDFITDPLIGPDRERNRALVEEAVMGRYGSALQAGLIAATARTWRDFADHVRECTARIGRDFQRCYGLDTTFLHLWGAEGRVRLLPETQNFVIREGVIERRAQSGVPLLLSQHGPIRGLHMTSDIRFINCWRYFNIHREHALSAGSAYALVPPEEPQDHPIPEDFARLAEEAGLEVVSLTGEASASWNVFRTAEGLSILGQGAHEITVRTTRPMDPLVLTVMYLSGTPGPISPHFSIAGQELEVGRYYNMWASMTVGEKAEVRMWTQELPGQHTSIVWTLSGKFSMSQ